MTVQRILEEKGREVVTSTAATSLGEIARLLHDKRIGAVVILDGQAIVGILSERDIVRALAVHGEAALSKPARECMTERVVTCRPEDTIDQLMQTMTSGRFRHIPVVENGRLAGIVSIGDVVKRRISEVEKEAEQIRQYIATA